ncbi:MAG: hypothetical protein H0V27_03585 [Pyrinomonadaceae bacterium]|nr:hypothetical protein [Pyrinomonadaceae bacterium]
MGRRRATITVETRQVTVVRRRGQSLKGWCSACAAEVQMLTPEGAAQLLATTPRAIYRRVENGDLHFVESGSGALLICCVSAVNIEQTLAPHRKPKPR